MISNKIYFESSDGPAINPERATKFSAGYDFYSTEDKVIPPMLGLDNFKNFLASLSQKEFNDIGPELTSLSSKLTEKGINLSMLYLVEKEEIDKVVPKDSTLSGYISRYYDVLSKAVSPVLVDTGIKVHMPEDMTLIMYNRSSNPSKKGLVLANGSGVVDADYPGTIKFPWYNISTFPYVIHAGDKLGQGIFQKYYLTDDDSAEGARTGGFGSTD